MVEWLTVRIGRRGLQERDEVEDQEEQKCLVGQGGEQEEGWGGVDKGNLVRLTG